MGLRDRILQRHRAPDTTYQTRIRTIELVLLATVVLTTLVGLVILVPPLLSR